MSLLRMLAVAAVAGGVAMLAGCASKAPAPHEIREPGVPLDEPQPVARPGYYIIKRGDTLYSIAHQFNRELRELVAWNALENPNVIRVGQELRVVPPEGSAAQRATASAEGNEMRAVPAPVAISSSTEGPISKPAPAAAAAAPAGGLKTEPKGGRLAYSAQAWKDLQTPAAEAPAAVPAATPAAPATAPAAAPEGALNWGWPGAGAVLAKFNDSSNKGVDLGGSVGDAVLAAETGRVMYAGSALRGYGNLVIIKHSSGFQSVYAHNREILVKEGQTVQKGQKIATLGNSDADRPKLHFEIRQQGKPVDPLKFLPAR